MKAAFRTSYGLPDVLSVKEVPKPTPTGKQVLVRVHAATVNRSDYHVLTGKPSFMRLLTGLGTPRLSITGSDFAGTVEVVGDDVKNYKVGDKVMGFIDMGAQSHAEYLAIDGSKITFTPSNLSYEESVACIEGAFYAQSAICPIRFVAGQTALLIGSTGAIGSSYLQLLKFHGIKVTAVCKTEHFALVRSLGASAVLDYEKEDFMKLNTTFEYVFDAVGKCSFHDCKHLLKPKGIYTSSHPNFLTALVTPLLGGRRELFVFPNRVVETLKFIAGLAEGKHFVPVIDRTYPLEKIQEAYQYVGAGHKVGNVVIVP